MWNDILATELTATVPRLDIPVYLLSGSYDYSVSYVLAKQYFEKLRAPVKGFYTCKQSAHSPLFEEPQRFGEILQRDGLAGSTGLADLPVPAHR